jgi:hypothetical protein
MEEAVMSKTYEVSERMVQQLAHVFSYHEPKSDQPDRYVAIRTKAHELALLIAELTPPSREQSVAMTNLEQAVFWANSAIFRNE